jgi:hypothetical protein
MRSGTETLVAAALAFAFSVVAATIDGTAVARCDSKPGANFNDRGPSSCDDSADDLKERAQKLRAALERRYQELRAAHQLSGGLHGTDVSNDVRPYIAAGMSFDDAESILRDAGFVVGKRPGSEPPPGLNRAADWYAVVAKIGPFSAAFGTKIDLYVSLLPTSPADYAKVQKVSAVFFVSNP